MAVELASMPELLHCSRCSHKKPVDAFIRAQKGGNGMVRKKFRTCNDYHKRFERYEGKRVAEEDDSAVGDDDDEVSGCESFKCNHSEMVDELRDIFEAEEVEKTFVDIEEDSDAAVKPTELHPATWARAHVIPDLECGSQYYWEVRKGYILDKSTCKFSLLLWCCSRADRVRFRQDKQAGTQRQQEKRKRIERFECYGEAKIIVDLSARTLEMFIQHLCKHENPHYRESNVPEAAIAFLETHVNSQLRRIDLYNLLCKEGLIDLVLVRKAQINFWISELLGRAYVRDVNNQLHSAKLVLEEPKLRSLNFEVILYDDTDSLAAIAFITPFWSRVDSVHEIVVDSTFKTNALKFELFAVSANIGGVGMPLSYLLFNKRRDDSSVQDTETNRKQTLTRWFCAMRERGLKPVFAVTDKDLGQIAAIGEALPLTYIQLCLWHALRAIETRILSENKSTNPYSGEEAHSVFQFIDPLFEPRSPVGGDGICPSSAKKAVIRWFARHYDLSPLVPTRDGVYLLMQQLHASATEESYLWCREQDLPHFWAYLWNHWYRPDRWKIFSRGAKPVLCFGRTTNIIESHWRGLKYDYKYSCKRPRLDKLVHIIATGLLSDKAIAFAQYDVSREQPLWWLNYRTRVRKLKGERAAAQSSHHFFDLGKWVCSCHEFISDKYLLCIHLVQAYFAAGRDFPRYESTYRRYSIPLFVFDDSSKMFSRNLLENELNPWSLATEAVQRAESVAVDANNGVTVDSDIPEVGDEAILDTADDDREAFKEAMDSLYSNVMYLLTEHGDNGRFVSKLWASMRRFERDVDACLKVLRQRGQQGTWTTRGPADLLR